MAITRPEALRRAATIWTPGTVPYSMTTVHQPDEYREDCSGYVSLCWALPPPGGSTVTMAPPSSSAVMVPISEADLEPGDAIGKCGPGTGGAAGHIQLFDGWDPDGTGLWIWEQAGGVIGPRRRKVKTVGQGGGFTPWRYTGIIDVSAGEDDDMPMLIRVNQTGLIAIGSGPTWSRLPSLAAVEAAQRIWGLGAPLPIDQADLAGFGVDVATLGEGGTGSSVTAAEVSEIVRAELDQTGLSKIQ